MGFYIVAAVLAVGIIATILLIGFSENKKINPYLPALITWMLGFLYYCFFLIFKSGPDPVGHFFALMIMAIAVISSSISWGIAEVWVKQKDIAKPKARKLILILNLATVIIHIVIAKAV